MEDIQTQTDTQKCFSKANKEEAGLTVNYQVRLKARLFILDTNIVSHQTPY